MTQPLPHLPPHALCSLGFLKLLDPLSGFSFTLVPPAIGIGLGGSQLLLQGALGLLFLLQGLSQLGNVRLGRPQLRLSI